MKVSIDWLKELVDLKIPVDDLVSLIPLRIQGGIKEVTNNYIELDLKGYNRADLLSLRGVALEVAAITDSKVKFEEKEENKFIWNDKNLPSTPVSIEKESLSLVQAVAKIEELKVATSPKEWVKKLNDSGMRSVNNIADVTNLVMLEYGHPLHAFDAKTVKDDIINVRRAKDGEEIVTLDGKSRKLTREDIVLADEEKALDVAGVMGGKGTEVKDTTTIILLSASFFNPQMVRNTSLRLKLASEASKRFYHGLTKKRLLQALDGAIRMYQSLGGKLTALTIIGDTIDQSKKIPLTLKKTNSLIGVDLKSEQVERYLKKLHFKIKDTNSLGVKPNHLPGGKIWEVEIPFWRLDIEIEEDLIEEVARMYGYEKIPAKKLEGDIPEKIDQTFFDLIQNLKNSLVSLRLTEVQTYSFFSTKVLDYFDWDKKDLVKVANPISSETEYLRSDLWPNLVEVVDKNLRQGFEDIAVFEIGKIYHPGDKPSEEYRLSIALMNGSDNPILELYQIFQSLGVHLEGVKLNLDLKKGEYEEKYFHPNRFAFLEKNGISIGEIAEVHPRFINKFGVDKRAAVLEIELFNS